MKYFGTEKGTSEQRLADAKGSYRYWATQLRLDLSDLIIKKLKATNKPQSWAAEQSGKRESFISRLIHADANFTASVAAKVLFNIGVRPKLVDLEEWETLKKKAESHKSDSLTGNIERSIDIDIQSPTISESIESISNCGERKDADSKPHSGTICLAWGTNYHVGRSRSTVGENFNGNQSNFPHRFCIISHN